MNENLDPFSVRGIAFLVIWILMVVVSLAGGLALVRVQKRWITWQEMVTKSPRENVKTLCGAFKNRAGLLFVVSLALCALMLLVLKGV